METKNTKSNPFDAFASQISASLSVWNPFGIRLGSVCWNRNREDLPIYMPLFRKTSPTNMRAARFADWPANRRWSRCTMSRRGRNRRAPTRRIEWKNIVRTFCYKSQANILVERTSSAPHRDVGARSVEERFIDADDVPRFRRRGRLWRLRVSGSLRQTARRARRGAPAREWRICALFPLPDRLSPLKSK